MFKYDVFIYTPEFEFVCSTNNPCVSDITTALEMLYGDQLLGVDIRPYDPEETDDASD